MAFGDTVRVYTAAVDTAAEHVVVDGRHRADGGEHGGRKGDEGELHG